MWLYCTGRKTDYSLPIFPDRLGENDFNFEVWVLPFQLVVKHNSKNSEIRQFTKKLSELRSSPNAGNVILGPIPSSFFSLIEKERSTGFDFDWEPKNHFELGMHLLLEPTESSVSWTYHNIQLSNDLDYFSRNLNARLNTNELQFLESLQQCALKQAFIVSLKNSFIYKIRKEDV